MKLKYRQQVLIDAWNGFEQTEPEASTERLIEMVCQTFLVEPAEVLEALETQKDKP